MNVTVNDKVKAWLLKQASAVRTTFNTKCGEAVDDDLSTWRNVGVGNYDYRASGNFRVVATKSGNNFNVAAIYKHAPAGGKQKVCGQTVTRY